MHHARGKAGALLDGPPGLVLGNEVLARAAGREQQRRAEKANNYAGHDGAAWDGNATRANPNVGLIPVFPGR